MTITTLAPRPLKVKKLYIDGFYVKEEDGKYWIGHQSGLEGNIHECRITENFYNDFLKESGREAAKYKTLLS